VRGIEYKAELAPLPFIAHTVHVTTVAVISLDDTNVYEIASTSLRHALSFERAHRRF
jgi:hypothetical protein